jgi:hypothetical protein
METMTEIKRCSCCGQIISKREIALYRGLVVALCRVWKYVKQRGGGYNFTRKEVKHLFKNENDTARFGDLVFFGGLLFKESKAHWGMNIERCDQFFAGKYAIPTRIWKDPISGEIAKEDYRFIQQIPTIIEKLNDEGFYIANYKDDLF